MLPYGIEANITAVGSVTIALPIRTCHLYGIATRRAYLRFCVVCAWSLGLAAFMRPFYTHEECKLLWSSKGDHEG